MAGMLCFSQQPEGDGAKGNGHVVSRNTLNMHRSSFALGYFEVDLVLSDGGTCV